MAFYDQMQTMASGLLSKFKQGTVYLVVTTPTPGADAFREDTLATPVSYELDAVARDAGTQEIDGDRVLSGDKFVTFAVPADVTPSQERGDHIEIDGVDYGIVNLRQIPAAGTPVSYAAQVRAA